MDKKFKKKAEQFWLLGNKIDIIKENNMNKLKLFNNLLNEAFDDDYKTYQTKKAEYESGKSAWDAQEQARIKALNQKRDATHKEINLMIKKAGFKIIDSSFCKTDLRYGQSYRLSRVEYKLDSGTACKIELIIDANGESYRLDYTGKGSGWGRGSFDDLNYKERASLFSKLAKLQDYLDAGGYDEIKTKLTSDLFKDDRPKKYADSYYDEIEDKWIETPGRKQQDEVRNFGSAARMSWDDEAWGRVKVGDSVEFYHNKDGWTPGARVFEIDGDNYLISTPAGRQMSVTKSKIRPCRKNRPGDLDDY